MPKAATKKKWKVSLFSCFDNFDNAKLSCPVTLCQCISAAQLFQRIFGFGCLPVSIILWGFVCSTLLWLTSCYLSFYNYFAFDVMTITNPFTDTQYFTMMMVFSALGFTCALMSIVCGTILLCRIRRRIRKRDSLHTKVRGMDDCCVPFWCGPCAILQMLRHDGVTATTYSLCSPTAGPLSPTPNKSKKKNDKHQKTTWSKRATCICALAMTLCVALAMTAFTTMVTTAIVLDLSKVHNTSNARMRPMSVSEARRRRLMYKKDITSYDAVTSSPFTDSDKNEKNVATIECKEPDELLENFQIAHVYGRGYPDLEGLYAHRLELYDEEVVTPYGIDTLAATHSDSLNTRDTLGCRLYVNVTTPLMQSQQPGLNSTTFNLTATLLNSLPVQDYHIECVTSMQCYVLFGSEDDADAAIITLQDVLPFTATFEKDVRRIMRYYSPGNVLLGCKDAVDYIKRGKYTCGIATLTVEYKYADSGRELRDGDITTKFHAYWLYPSISRFLLSGLPYGHIEGWYRNAITNNNNGKSCDVRIDWLIDFDDTFPQNNTNTFIEVLDIEEQLQPNPELEPGGSRSGVLPFPTRGVEDFVLNFPGWKLSTKTQGWFGPFWKDMCHTFGLKTKINTRNEYSLRCRGFCNPEKSCPDDKFLVPPSTRHNVSKRRESCPTCKLSASDLYGYEVDEKVWKDPCVDIKVNKFGKQEVKTKQTNNTMKYWACDIHRQKY